MVLSPAPGLELTEVWRSEAVGPGALAGADRSREPFVPEPAAGGVLFRLVTFPPDPAGHMHRTASLDLALLVSGELVLALDGGEEQTVRPGDTVVLRGAMHAWRNLTNQPAVLAVVMLSAAHT
jgi:quercetin dioxygenase-like cupin family protein